MGLSGHHRGHDRQHDFHHAHSHGHHGHHHGDPSHGAAFASGIALNVIFVIIEASYGWISGSMALIADAGHNLSDVAALAIAWGASWLAMRKPDARYSYGKKSATILAALANSMLLLLAIGWIVWESIHRLDTPELPQPGAMMIVAAIGIVVNGVTALLFARGRHNDLNLRGAFLHMLGDAAISAGVVLAGLAIWLTKEPRIDPVVSLLIAAIIGFASWRLLRDALRMALGAVPPHIDADAVEAWLAGLGGVSAVHHLHIWSLSTVQSAMTVHLVLDDAQRNADSLLREAETGLRQQFAITHSTIQIERASCQETADCGGDRHHRHNHG